MTSFDASRVIFSPTFNYKCVDPTSDCIVWNVQH